MAKQTRKNLSERAGIVKAETVLGANTATRIGSLEQDTISSAVLDWDATSAYSPGELAHWQGRIVVCFAPTTPNQSPASHPTLWTDYVVDSLAKLLASVTDYPVLASAVKAYVSSRLAEVNGVSGGAAEASSDEVSAGQVHSKFISPARLKPITDALTAAIADVLAHVSSSAGTNPAVSTDLLQDVTARPKGDRTANNISLTGGGNFIKWLASLHSQAGLYFRLGDVDGAFTDQGGLKYLDLNRITLDNALIALELLGNDALLNATRLLMPTTTVQLSVLKVTQLLAATQDSAGLFGPQVDPVTKEITMVVYDRKKLWEFLRPEADEWARDNGFTAVKSSPSPVGTIYCRPKTAAPLTSNGRDFVIRSNQFGVQQSHGLELTGDQIMVTLLGPNSRDASQYIGIDFSGTDSFTITADNADTAADASFYIKLNLRPMSL